ncbi:uncharacterized protein [Fopius arisanus]|uniref:Uncharacterized protein n=1 Tax=Fopius arisanus TaxID=64838 RepID=A0A9R1TE92_9HYME|nr:PREDICTED: uncharacterized protein LOC105269180 [Fopius arisanus]
MGSSRQPDHLLGNGMSFPQWMRGKVDSRFDFDQGTFSPPSHDDSFLCIRYAKSNNSTQQQEGFRPINQVLNDPKPVNDEKSLPSSGINKISDIKEIDFSKHPLPCQPFVPASKERQRSKYEFLQKSPQTKSQGTDDGFHGEPARCGKSIVNVATRMMLGTLNKKSEQHVNSKMEKNEILIRKGSQSLPVTPIASPTSSPEGSPKSRRRAQGNRYFTGSFIPDRDKYQGGWLLSSILSQSREIVGNKIEEEDEVADVVPPKTLSRKKSISSQNLSYLGKEDTTPKTSITQATVTFQAKPSELREMNFWSPTSM